ncbi:MAG: Ig domain-containing protein, partial [Lachnospira sp.]
TATAKEGYKFEGWYDSTGTAVDTSLLSDDGKTLSYITTENATYYARFAKIELTQTFERQLKSGSSWTTAGDTVGTLSRYTFTDYYGERVSVTATAKEGYKFEGWYDSTGNAVDTSLLSDDGKTLSYITTVNATYYARFAKIVLEERFTEILTQKDNALDLMSIVTSEYVEGKSLTWESSNTDIVTVDSNGNVLAVRNGVCTVFARTADGSYTAEFTITVNIQEQESGSDNDTEESTEESTEEGTNADNDDNDEITTGDNSRVLLWFILSMVSVSFITALYAGRMKVNVKNK